MTYVALPMMGRQVGIFGHDDRLVDLLDREEVLRLAQIEADIKSKVRVNAHQVEIQTEPPVCLSLAEVVELWKEDQERRHWAHLAMNQGVA